MRLRAVAPALLSLVSIAASAQVAVIRDLPEKGANPVAASWTRPAASPSLADTKPTQLSGTIFLGSSGGIPQSGALQFDLFTDSALELVQVLGASRLLVAGSAARRLLLEGQMQDYALELGLGGERWQVGLDGGYAVDEKLGLDGPVLRATARAGLDTVLRFAESLPVTLAASYSWDRELARENRDDPGTVTDERMSGSAALKAVGAIGSLGLDTGATVRYDWDPLEVTDALGVGAKVGVRIPLTESFGLSAALEPSYSLKHAEEASVRTWALDSTAGVVLTFRRSLELALRGGRNDTWTWQTGQGEAYLGRWLGILGTTFAAERGVHAEAGYTIGIPALSSGVETAVSHLVTAGAGWTVERREPGLVREVSAEGSLQTGDTRQAAWDAGITVAPLDAMSVAASYGGAWVESSTAVSLDHVLRAQLEHEPLEALSYGAGAALDWDLESGSWGLDQSYDGTVTLRPLVRGSRVPFSVGENLTVAADGAMASALGLGLELPLARWLRMSYRFSWEHTEEAAADPGDVFRHRGGLAVSPESPAVRFLVDYLFVHGTVGVRHDLRGSIVVPVWRGLSVRAELDFSSYTEGGTLETPFLFRIAGTYEL